MRKFYVYILLSLAVLCANKLKAQVNVNDSLALVDLYNSTDGPNWKRNDNWLQHLPVSAWYGVTVLNNRVNELRLTGNNLVNILPASIGNLSELTSLKLYSNKLSGNIPKEIGNILKLTYLNISSNNFTGSIPKEIGNLTALTELYLSNNNLTDSIPSSIGNLTSLNTVYLNNNKLTGGIPLTIGNLGSQSTEPKYIYFIRNKLSGNIPDDITHIKKIAELDLSYNNLSGNIPAKLGTADYYKNAILNFSYNKLTGSIPKSFDSSNNITTIDFSYNQLSGSLPEYIGIRINSKGRLKLSHNNLSGSLPDTMNTERIYLDNNNLSGSIPPSLTKTQYLNLSYNELSGSIPPELGNGIFIKLNLANNNLTGEIPAALAGTHTLDELILKDNNLTGNIPEEFGYAGLETLDVARNKLKGKIPESFKYAVVLKVFNVQGNQLRDTIPEFLSDLFYLYHLNVTFNYFTFDGLEKLVQKMNNKIIYDKEKHIKIYTTNNTLHVYAGGTLSNNTYRWYRNGFLSAKIIGDSTFTPTKNGNYTVQVTNSIATKLTLMSDTIAFTAGKPSDAIASSLKQFSIYPNPAKTFATVSFNGSGNYVLKLNDANGNLLQTKKIIAAKGLNTVTINVSNYTTGSYFITLIDDKQQKQTLQLNKL